MNEQHFAWKVRQQLEQGTRELDDATVEKLWHARQTALARQRVSSRSSMLAGIGNIGIDFSMPGLRAGVAVLGLALGVGAISAWNYYDTLLDPDELAQVDSELLADDLPLNAYLDRGFDKWLAHEASQ